MVRTGVTGWVLFSCLACEPTVQVPSCPRALNLTSGYVSYGQSLAATDGGLHYDFGDVGLDGGTVDLQFAENCGHVRINSVTLDGGPGFIFPAGGGAIGFAPTGYGNFQAVLTLVTDSEIQPVVAINLTGAAPAPGPACKTDVDCPSASFCHADFCQPACNGFSNLPDGDGGGRSCAPESTACAGDAGWLLVDTLGDAHNCGGCGKACPTGQGCGGGKCGSCAGYRIGPEQDFAIQVGPLDAGMWFGVTDVEVGDLDGDGDPDLLLAIGVGVPVTGGGAQVGSDSLLVIANDGRGGFGTAPRTIGACGSPLALGDFNGDCRLDVASAGAILLNDSHGNFPLRNSASTLVNADATQLTVMDLDGDGKADLAFGQWAPVVVIGNGKGSFSMPPSFSETQDLESFAVADFNLDGRPDIAGFLSSYPDAPLSFFVNEYGDDLSDLANYGDPGANGYPAAPSAFVAGDLAGTGQPALIYGEQSNVVVLPDPRSGPMGASLLDLDGGFTSLAVGDLDLDGRPDVLAAQASAFADAGLLDLWTEFTSQGGSLVPGHLQTAATSAPAAFVRMADLNGDGIPDILAVSSRFDRSATDQAPPVIMIFLGSCE